MKIYLDTNAFYFFFFDDNNYSKGIKKVISSITAGQNEGITSSLTLDELSYSILMRLIEKKYNSHPTEILRKNRNVIAEFSGIRIIPADRDVCSLIPIYMKKYSLLPRDCIHLATMHHNECDQILSTDTDFDNISGISRIDPNKV